MRLRHSLPPLVLALLLAGCSGPVLDMGPTAPDAAQVQSAAVQADRSGCVEGQETWRSPGPPKRGGTLVRAGELFDHLDQTRTGRAGLIAISQVYNTLVQYRGCFPSDTAMVPGLAASWQIVDEGRTWTLNLREDVKWQDRPPLNGRSFTSADVAWMIELQQREGVLRSYWENVTHGEPDPYTVVLRLPQPDADFLGRLGNPSNLMMPREVREQYGDFKTITIGTGAFVVVDVKPAQGEILLRANPSYRDKGEDGKPLPYIDEVRSIGFADYTAQLAALRAGQIDTTYTQGLRRLDSDALRQSNQKMRFWEILAFAPRAVWFNLSRKPFDDPRVRKAIALAIPPENLIEANRGGVAYGGFIPGSLVEWAWPQEKIKEKFKADPERAKKLLAELGVSALGELDLQTAGPGADEVEVIQRNLQAVGLRNKVTVLGSFTTVLQKGDYDLAWAGTSGVVFPGYWVGDFVRTGSSRNTMGFSDAPIDALADTQQREMDPVKRKQIVDQIQDRLYDLMPYYPAIGTIFYHALSCRTRNYIQIQPGYNTPGPLYAWLDPSGC